MYLSCCPSFSYKRCVNLVLKLHKKIHKIKYQIKSFTSLISFNLLLYILPVLNYITLFILCFFNLLEYFVDLFTSSLDYLNQS